MSSTVLALRALGLGDALTGVPALRGLRRAFPGAHLVLAAPAAVGALLVGHGVVDDVLDVAGIAPLAPDALVRAAAGAPPGLRGRLARGVDVAVNLHGDGPQSAAALAALAPQRTLALPLATAAAAEQDGQPEHPGPPEHPGTPEQPDGEQHEVDRWCALVRGAGGACGRDDLVLPALAAVQQRAARAARRGPSTVVLHPGAASGSRRWPVERWELLAMLLAQRGHDVAVTGTPGEAALCAQVAGTTGRDLCGSLDLEQLSETVAGACLLVCGDTGVAHLATAARTPSVLLFGPTPPARWGPAIDPGIHTVLWPCRAGSGAVGDPHGSDVDPVLAAITVDEVLSAADPLLTGGVDALVAALWDHQRESRDPPGALRLAHRDLADAPSRANHRLQQMVADREPETLDVLVRLAEAAPDDDALAWLGAGPVETWMERATEQDLAAAARRARAEPRFRTAVTAAWMSDVLERRWRDAGA